MHYSFGSNFVFGGNLSNARIILTTTENAEAQLRIKGLKGKNISLNPRLICCCYFHALCKTSRCKSIKNGIDIMISPST